MANPAISIDELATTCGLTRDGINYNILNLKKKASSVVSVQTKEDIGKLYNNRRYTTEGSWVMIWKSCSFTSEILHLIGGDAIK